MKWFKAKAFVFNVWMTVLLKPLPNKFTTCWFNCYFTPCSEPMSIHCIIMKKSEKWISGCEGCRREGLSVSSRSSSVQEKNGEAHCIKRNMPQRSSQAEELSCQVMTSILGRVKMWAFQQLFISWRNFAMIYIRRSQLWNVDTCDMLLVLHSFFIFSFVWAFTTWQKSSVHVVLLWQSFVCAQGKKNQPSFEYQPGSLFQQPRVFHYAKHQQRLI